MHQILLRLVTLAFGITSLFYLASVVVSDTAVGAIIERRSIETEEVLTDLDTSTNDLRVAVFEDTPYHDEVIGGVLTAIHDLQVNASFYRGGLNKGFENVIKDVWDFESNPPRDPDVFSSHIEQGSFDVILLVTCDPKFWGHRTDVIMAFSTRKDVQVICLLHEIEYFQEDEGNSRAMFSVPAVEGRLTLLTLSSHSSSSLRRALRMWKDQGDEWKNVEVVDIAPVFEVTGLPKTREDSRAVVSKAAIVGRMNYGRQYERIIRQLYEAIKNDPQVWGYRAEKAGGNDFSQIDKFIPLSDTQAPFTLHLIGYDEGSVIIPPELNDSANGSSPIVVKHSSNDYEEFYSLISQMDLILPAFTGDIYVKYRSSASIPAAIITQVPLLADASVLQAYSYLAEPSYVHQPSSMSEIETIGHLRHRRNIWERKSKSQRIQRYRRPTRDTTLWTSYLKDLRRSNCQALANVLHKSRH